MPPLWSGNSSVFSSGVCDAILETDGITGNVSCVCNIVHVGEAWSFSTSSLSESQWLEALF